MAPTLALRLFGPQAPPNQLCVAHCAGNTGIAVTTFSAVSRALEGDSVAVPGTSASDRSIASLAPTAALGLAVGAAERGIDVATRVAAPPGRFLVRATNPLTRSLEPIAAKKSLSRCTTNGLKPRTKREQLLANSAQTSSSR